MKKKQCSVFEIYASKRPTAKLVRVKSDGTMKIPQLKNDGAIKVIDFGTCILIQRLRSDKDENNI